MPNEAGDLKNNYDTIHNRTGANMRLKMSNAMIRRLMLMKFKIIVMLAIAIFLPGNVIGAKERPPPYPSAFIAQPEYTFDPVVDGTQVLHDYVIQNKGAGTLEIQKVKTG
jgi:hypothetical protein